MAEFNRLKDIIKTILTSKDVNERNKALHQHTYKVDEIANNFVEVLQWARVGDTPSVVMTMQDAAGNLYSAQFTCSNTTAKYYTEARQDVAQRVLSFINSDFT